MPRGPHDEEIQRKDNERDHARERLEQYRKERDSQTDKEIGIGPEKNQDDSPRKTGG